MNIESLLRQRMRDDSPELGPGPGIDAVAVRARARRLRRRRRGAGAVIVAACAVAVGSYAVIATRPSNDAVPPVHQTSRGQGWHSSPVGFLAVGRSADRRTLYFEVAESTRDRRSPCWSYFTASLAQLPDGTPSVTVTAWDKPGSENVSCAAIGVGPFYVTVHLGRALSGNQVYDAATDRIRRVDGIVHPTPDEDAGVSRSVPASLYRQAGTPRPHD